MRTSIAIVSALAATAAAGTVYNTIDVTITSCPPEVSSCPGENPPHPQTVYSTVDVTITSCPPEVDSCPGEYTQTATHPASTESVHFSEPYIHETPAGPSEYTHAPTTSSVHEVTPSATTYQSSVPSSPVAYSSVSIPPHEEYSSQYSGPATSIVPYPTSVVTIVTSSKTPVGTGTSTSVVRPSTNATSTSPPIASFTGAASSLSASYGTFASLALIAAFFLA